MSNRQKKSAIPKIPQRTCVACRRVRPKREMIRLVRLPDGGIEVDTTGKKAGRGAYLCSEWSCWDTGILKGRLEYSLHTRIDEKNRKELIDYGKTVTGSQESEEEV